MLSLESNCLKKVRMEHAKIVLSSYAAMYILFTSRRNCMKIILSQYLLKLKKVKKRSKHAIFIVAIMLFRARCSLPLWGLFNWN